MKRVLPSITVVFCFVISAVLMAGELDAWEPYFQRPALSPEFSRSEEGSTLTLKSSGDFHCNGSWRRSFDVSGGKFYRLRAEFKTDDVQYPRRSVLMRIDWHDSDGKRVGYPEYPSIVADAAQGWNGLEGSFPAPPDAARATVDLILRWDAKGSVHWRNVVFGEGEAIKPRPVTIATVNMRPRNSAGSAENLEIFGRMVAKAGEAKADIVCLPEGITLVGTPQNYVEAAEPVPGPTTRILGELARKHNLYIVAGILEKEGETVYNTAVLVNRKGELQGRYRKASLPREEIEGGITPGEEFPVFETDFGRIGIMICWDVHFQEPARRLAAKGAEIVMLPIWGGLEVLFPARAVENQVFLVTSSYDARTGIWDKEGTMLAEAAEEGTIAVATVDLAKVVYWEWLGDFRARIPREAPIAREE